MRSVSIWVDPTNEDHSQSVITSSSSINNDIVSLTLSPSEENAICSTRSQQLYTLTLSAADLGKVSDQYYIHTFLLIYSYLLSLTLQGAAFDFLSSSFHHGAITGLDVCLRKPVVVSCSMDKSIRIWNYENK